MTGEYAGERYWITTPQGRVPLPGTMKPAAHAPTARTFTLLRGRGRRRVWDLSDRMADPAPLVLTGEVNFGTEAELSLYLRELHNALRAATSFDRDGRRDTPLLGAALVSVPIDADSGWAALTITLVALYVPDPADPDPNYW